MGMTVLRPFSRFPLHVPGSGLITMMLAGLVVLCLFSTVLPSAQAQRPGQLSSSHGKRWFNASEPEPTGGLLSRVFDSRKAHRQAARQEAVKQAKAQANLEAAPENE